MNRPAPPVVLVLLMLVCSVMPWALLRTSVASVVPSVQAAGDTTRFVAVEVWIDALGQPLAAYQIELDAQTPIRIVGVENGQHRAFAHDPYFDRQAVDAGRADRLVLASFSLENKADLPSRATRVATVMVALGGTAPAERVFRATLQACANDDAQPIPAQVTLKVLQP